MKKKIFIDGEEGTTGLQINERLLKHPEVDILKIGHKVRKNPNFRKKMMLESDLTFLCLPDHAALESYSLVKDEIYKRPIIIDSSTAHRVSEDWIYGLPEISNEHKMKISNAKNISIPGCYATGVTTLLNPLLKNLYLLVLPNNHYINVL